MSEPKFDGAADDDLMRRVAQAIIKEGAQNPDFYQKISKALRDKQSNIDIAPAPKSPRAPLTPKKIKKITPKRHK